MRARLTLIAAAFSSLAALALLAPACDTAGGAAIDENADADGDGHLRKDDCDDHDPAVHPGATEPCSCDGEDDDCNGVVDDFDCALLCYPPADTDGDGFEPPADCNDSDPMINPMAQEPCACDTVDQNCSGDPQDFTCDLICYDDNDGDGFGTDTDCDDDNGSINPGAPENCECDSVDQNCNSSVTDIPTDCGITCTDGDGDGFYAEGDDCDDSDATVNPDEMEPCACDGNDNDCNDTPDDFDPAACTKMCTYLMSGETCTAGMEPECGPGLACCGMPATCVAECVDGMCMNGCPVAP